CRGCRCPTARPSVRRDIAQETCTAAYPESTRPVSIQLRPRLSWVQWSKQLPRRSAALQKSSGYPGCGPPSIASHVHRLAETLAELASQLRDHPASQARRSKQHQRPWRRAMRESVWLLLRLRKLIEEEVQLQELSLPPASQFQSRAPSRDNRRGHLARAKCCRASNRDGQCPADALREPRNKPVREYRRPNKAAADSLQPARRSTCSRQGIP